MNISTVIFIGGFLLLTIVTGVKVENAEEEDGWAEASAVSLESTGELAPRPQLVAKIRKDLNKIRINDRQLMTFKHEPKWDIGRLSTDGKNKEKVKALKESEFKPVIVRQEEKGSLSLTFLQPYHPERLAKLLKLRFNLESKPVENHNRKNFVMYRPEIGAYYFNPNDGLSCEIGCLAQYSVSSDVDLQDQFFTNMI